MTTPNIRECDFCCSGPLEPIHAATCVEVIDGKEMAACDECCEHDEGCRKRIEQEAKERFAEEEAWREIRERAGACPSYEIEGDKKGGAK
jgi:hypothetical protein